MAIREQRGGDGDGKEEEGEIRVDASLSCNATSIGLYESSRRGKAGGTRGKVR